MLGTQNLPVQVRGNHGGNLCAQVLTDPYKIHCVASFGQQPFHNGQFQRDFPFHQIQGGFVFQRQIHQRIFHPHDTADGIDDITNPRIADIHRIFALAFQISYCGIVIIVIRIRYRERKDGFGIGITEREDTEIVIAAVFVGNPTGVEAVFGVYRAAFHIGKQFGTGITWPCGTVIHTQNFPKRRIIPVRNPQFPTERHMNGGIGTVIDRNPVGFFKGKSF